MTKINGGATLWARQTVDSDIFFNKPDKWFKIWFYLVTKANHKDNKQFKRGSCFMKYEWIIFATGATRDQVKHCIEFLKSDKMLATQKATRGFTLKVLNYNGYQTLDNYKSHTKSHLKATQKPHRSHTINKNDKNVKNEEEIKERKEVQKLISASLEKDPKKEKKKANNIEFDFENWSWHGIDEDILDDWAKRFPDIDIPVELMNIREYFKNHPEKKKYIKNYAIYINDWLERVSGWKKEIPPCNKPKK